MTKLIQVNVPSINGRRAKAFYNTLFSDNKFARSLTEEVEAYHVPISNDGIQLTVTPRQAEGESIMCFFAVDDLDATLGELEHEGGSVVREPFQLPISGSALDSYREQVQLHHPDVGDLQSYVGTAAIVSDPDNNLIGLIELLPQAYSLFSYSDHATALTDEQLAQHNRGIELGSLVKLRS